MQSDQVRKAVREGYARRAQGGTSCCSGVGCCGTPTSTSEAIGYTADELRSIPAGADLGLGCGNPTSLAGLKEGEAVLDLGSGAGIDCFLAARIVGEAGHVIGVDMTPEMVDRARENARTYQFENVEFRLGEIEHLPVADAAVDVVISNCVINLSPDKPRVFREAYRVLRPGGRMVVSDLVLRRELPDEVRSSLEAYVACVAGAARKDDYLAMIRAAGFEGIRVLKEAPADAALPGTADGDGVPAIVSLTLEATKPTTG
ncbi:MAG: arsenite methyltransferase [Candidatus Bipolaricaulota bacterium]|nr:arsenite methyltransferase [Candidatus Bipolaricaulota bacterium]